MRALDDHFYPRYFENYELGTGAVKNIEFFKSPFVSNFFSFAYSQTNTILVYFERSKSIAEETIALIEAQIGKTK